MPRKNKPGQGRKPEGRVRVLVQISPEAVKKLDALRTGKGDSRGRVIERLLGL